MKKIGGLLLVILFITTCLTVSSCTSRTNEHKKEQGNQSLTLVPIYWNSRGGLSYDIKLSYELKSFAIKNSNGEFIMFDNDVDCSSYCYTISFICEVFDAFQFNDLQNLREEKWEKCNEIINCTLLFMQNKKQEIQDPEILEAIEKAYYDVMVKISQEYYISNDGYGWKNYTPMTYPGQYCFNRVFTGSWKQGLKNDYTPENDIEIPDGALIFTVRDTMFGHYN